MTSHPLKSPALQTGYSGDEPVPDELKEGPTRDDHAHEAETATGNRGRRAPQDGSGAAVGSGAGAGGGGGDEDFDDDPKAGGGSLSLTPSVSGTDRYADGHDENSA